MPWITVRNRLRNLRWGDFCFLFSLFFRCSVCSMFKIVIHITIWIFTVNMQPIFDALFSECENILTEFLTILISIFSKFIHHFWICIGLHIHFNLIFNEFIFYNDKAVQLAISMMWTKSLMRKKNGADTKSIINEHLISGWSLDF